MAAPKTVLTYPLDGTNREFTIPFEYLARKFIVVTLIGKNRQVLTLNSDYRFTSRTAITTTKAWGPGDLFTSLELRRVTSATERLVDFADGSILRAYDLNTSQVQSLHIAEEARDLTADTIGVNNDGDLDARGRKIVNVGDGVRDGDAVNMGQNRRWAESALSQANRSQAEADRSTLQANESSRHSGSSAGSAAASENSAVRSYADANRAKQEADNSGLYNAQSGRYAAEAKLWAQYPEDTPVQVGIYSALHYAAKSGKSAAASENSAVRSYADANRAKGEADRAKTEADKLGNANEFMATLGSVSSPWVTWRDPWGLAAKRVGTDQLHSFSGKAIQVVGPGLVVAEGMTAGIVYATDFVDAANGVYDQGQRVWGKGNFNPDLKADKNGGGKGALLAYTNQNPNGQSGASQTLLASLELREANRFAAQTGGDELYSPSIAFNYEGYAQRKMLMSANGALKWGTYLGGFRGFKVRPVAYKEVFSGTFVNGQTIQLGESVLGRVLFVHSVYSGSAVGSVGVLVNPEAGVSHIVSWGGGWWALVFLADGTCRMVGAGSGVSAITRITLQNDEAT